MVHLLVLFRTSLKDAIVLTKFVMSTTMMTNPQVDSKESSETKYSRYCRRLFDINDVEEARCIINNDPYTVNALDEHNCTPLHHILDIDVAEFLLDHGAFIEAYDDDNYHCTVFHGIQDLIVHLKHERKLDTDFSLGGGLTPLHYAVYRNNLPLVECLLCRGANLHYRNNELGIAPIHLANTVAMFDLLRAKGADVASPTYFTHTILHILAAYTDRDTAPLIRHIVALQRQWPNSLLDFRSDAVHSCTPMHYARTKAAAAALHELGANIAPLSARLGTPLHVLAMTAGCAEHHAADQQDACRDGLTIPPLDVGALNELVSFFVAGSSDGKDFVNRMNSFGVVALHLVHHAALVHCLVAHGAQVNACVATNHTGLPPLFTACNVNVCRALVDCGADVNVIAYGVSAVLNSRRDDVAAWLISRGARWLSDDNLHAAFRRQVDAAGHERELPPTAEHWYELPEESRPTLDSLGGRSALKELVQNRRNQFSQCNNGVVQLALVRFLGRELEGISQVCLHDVYPLQAACSAAVVRALLTRWMEALASASAVQHVEETPGTLAPRSFSTLSRYVNSGDYLHERTPLHCARNAAIARCLLESGALPDLHCSRGRAPIHHAADGETFMILAEHLNGAMLCPTMDGSGAGEGPKNFRYPLGEFTERYLLVRPHQTVALWRHLLCYSTRARHNDGSQLTLTLEPLLSKYDYEELSSMWCYRELLMALQCERLMRFLCGFGLLPLHCQQLRWLVDTEETSDPCECTDAELSTDGEPAAALDSDHVDSPMTLVFGNEALCLRMFQHLRHGTEVPE